MRRKERAAGYIRESDPGLADSNTMESQAKAVRLYCQKQGYDYTADHEYKEAISSYSISYTERSKLMEMLRAAQRKEFDVLVVSEIRALSRKQAEIFVVYDMLEKYGVRLETITERFDESDMGRIILARRAAFSEIERNQMVMRTERGKADRIANGNLPGHGCAPYGFVYVDTDRETSARLELDETIIFVDSQGHEWSAVIVVRFVFESVSKGVSIKQTARYLTQLGIPTPRRGQWWHTGTIYRMLINPLYTGEAVVHRYKKEKNKTTLRPKEEHVSLGDGLIPPIVSKEVFKKVQEQLAINKQDALRNNHIQQSDLGILRAGFCHCGICARTMTIRYPKVSKPYYRCQKRTGRQEYIHNHQIFITAERIDSVAWEKVKELVTNPTLVRERVEQIRSENKTVIGRGEIEARIANLERQLSNLFKLAQDATDDDTIENLKLLMKDLEKQKRDAQGLLYDADEDEEKRHKIEEEIQKFEHWASQVRPIITDPLYQPSYKEKRLAVRILGIHAIVCPGTKGHHEIHVEIAPPKITEILEGDTIAFRASSDCGLLRWRQ